jgi:hypothetical protein
MKQRRSVKGVYWRRSLLSSVLMSFSFFLRVKRYAHKVSYRGLAVEVIYPRRRTAKSIISSSTSIRIDAGRRVVVSVFLATTQRGSSSSLPGRRETFKKGGCRRQNPKKQTDKANRHTWWPDRQSAAVPDTQARPGRPDSYKVGNSRESRVQSQYLDGEPYRKRRRMHGKRKFWIQPLRSSPRLHPRTSE